MSNTYPVGDVVRLSVAFTSSGIATDPTTVTLMVKGPSIYGLQTFTYAAAQLVRDSTGDYHYDLTVPYSGEWYYRFAGGGALIAASEGTFVAGPSYFL